MIRLGQRRRIPREQFLTDWAEHIASGVGVALFVIAVLILCGLNPRGLADLHLPDMHLTIITDAGR